MPDEREMNVHQDPSRCIHGNNVITCSICGTYPTCAVPELRPIPEDPYPLEERFKRYDEAIETLNRASAVLNKLCDRVLRLEMAKPLMAADAHKTARENSDSIVREVFDPEAELRTETWATITSCASDLGADSAKVAIGKNNRVCMIRFTYD